MKKPLLNFLISCFSIHIFILITQAASATIHVINVSDFQFSPSSTNVIVNDTIRWQWINGSHTTTSLSVPSGAATWDNPISSSSPSFDYKVTVAGTYTYKCTPHFPTMQGTFTADPVGITEINMEESFKWSISDNELNVSFNLPTTANITISLFSLLGKEAAELASAKNVHGFYERKFSLSELSRGIYFLSVTADNKKVVRKIIID